MAAYKALRRFCVRTYNQPSLYLFISDNHVLNFCLDFVLKDGDVVKLDLGVHVDGYIAVVAHTVILSEAKKSRAADALLAAHYCAEAALRLVKPGNEVNQLFKNIKTSFIFE